MGPQYWLRWMSVHGVPRMALKTYARRGDPLAQLFGDPAITHDPYPLLESIRARGRLVRTPFARVTVEHDLCRNILRDNAMGTRAAESFDIPRPLRGLTRLAPLPPNPVEPPSMLVIDPPEHTRMRRSVSAAFTPRAIRRLQDRVESVTEELLDAMPGDGSADLVADFAAQVPIAIISDMLGFPRSAKEQFLGWGDAISPLLDIGIPWHSYRGAVAAIREMDEYADGHLAQLRRSPGEDILSSLLTAGDLDEQDLKATASLLMGAGFETTVNLIGNAIVQLLAHPDQLARLRAEPELWPNAVEEVLRFDAPVQNTGRVTLEEVEYEGVRLRKGTTVVLSLAGANRDPNVFEQPNRFDITRANAKEHLTFSSGIHACLGASLARMEATHALRALFDRFPDLRLDGPPQRRPLFTLHGYSHMRANLGRRAEHTTPV
ncbi:cytochrome P450 [Nocardia macrotermitis]|uniref:Putative cytochrome P450 140 n=1 Tax=Nocardia macrotermitis TaxID=2585198 RepID=A0A7K0D2N6_9NOCA|nr:cytochrome P450 [Nocardia macrotermitis]MQY19975.1 putative cytochrome P450 140 [Nocardia macrotermitis]